MAKKTKDSNLSIEERLEQALIPNWDEPYKLPENWCWVKIGSINNYIGHSIDPTNTPTNTFELYSVPSNDNNYPEILMGNEIGSTKQSVEKDDVLLCKINPRINRVWKVAHHTKHTLLASSEWIIVRNKHINSDYLMWCLKSPYFREFMLSNVSGIGGSLMRAQPKYVQNYPIPLPPVPEQKRIVTHIESLFSKLDEAKEKAQEVVDGFETRKAAILHKAFSGELTTKWREEHLAEENTIIENVAKHSTSWTKKEQQLLHDEQLKARTFIMSNDHRWIECTIGAIARVNNGSTPSRQKSEYWNGHISWVSSGEVRNNLIYETLEKITEEGFDNTSVKLLPVNTVLIAMIGEGKTRGQSAILKTPATTNQNIAAIIMDHGLIVPEYMWYWLQMNYSKNREVGSGSGQQALNCQRVRELNFIFPGYKEQHEIVRILDTLVLREQRVKESAEAVIEQIDTMKKAILARAFRGELGTNDPSEESAVELLKSVLSGNTNQQEPQKSNKKSTCIPKHIETALLTKLEKKIVSLFYTTESKVVSVDEIMSVSSKKIEIIDTLTKLEQRRILIRLNNSCYRIKE